MHCLKKQLWIASLLLFHSFIYETLVWADSTCNMGPALEGVAVKGEKLELNGLPKKGLAPFFIGFLKKIENTASDQVFFKGELTECLAYELKLTNIRISFETEGIADFLKERGINISEPEGRRDLTARNALANEAGRLLLYRARLGGMDIKNFTPFVLTHATFFEAMKNLVSESKELQCEEGITFSNKFTVQEGFSFTDDVSSKNVSAFLIIEADATLVLKCLKRISCCVADFRFFDDEIGTSSDALLRECPEGPAVELPDLLSAESLPKCGVSLLELPRVGFYITQSEAEEGFKKMKEALNAACIEKCPESSSEISNRCVGKADGYPIFDIDREAILKRQKELLDTPGGPAEVERQDYFLVHDRLIGSPGKFDAMRNLANQQNNPGHAPLGSYMAIIEKFFCLCIPCKRAVAPEELLPPPASSNRCLDWRVEGGEAIDGGESASFRITTNFKPPDDWYSYFVGVSIFDDRNNFSLFLFNQRHAGVESVGGSGLSGEVSATGTKEPEGAFTITIKKSNLPPNVSGATLAGGCMETAEGPFQDKGLPPFQIDMKDFQTRVGF